MTYFLDIEILADRWEEEQRLIQELMEAESNVQN